MKLSEFRNQLKWIMKYSWVLYRRGVGSFSTALKLSWQIMKSRIQRHHTKLRGTSHQQTNIRCISKLQPDQYNIQFVKEPTNSYDVNAIKVVAVVLGKSVLKLGYLSKKLADLWSNYFNNGFEAKVVNYDVTGEIRVGRFLGINVTYVVVPTTDDFA